MLYMWICYAVCVLVIDKLCLLVVIVLLTVLFGGF